jgi:hypothetical protein
MPNSTAEPKVIPPSSVSDKSGLPDETLLLLASLLDDVFRIPGTSIRFGIDPLLGLVPAFGDFICGLASFVIIFAAWQRQLPRVTVARMVVNVAVDSLVGSIPILGDAFDVTWKSNRKNMNLLQREKAGSPRSQNWRDWLFLGGIVLLLTVLIAVPVVTATLLIRYLLHR